MIKKLSRTPASLIYDGSTNIINGNTSSNYPPPATQITVGGVLKNVAVCEMQSIVAGCLLPRMTTVQLKAAIPPGQPKAVGASVYDLTINKLAVYTHAVTVLAPVQAATTAAITLATDLANGLVIDGYTMVTGDRILVKNQTSTVANGIYIVPATAGSPARSSDMAIASNAYYKYISVINGTLNANTGWTETATPAIVGTNNLVFTALSGWEQVTSVAY